MPTYRVTDPATGKSLKLTGDSPPTEQELEQIFASVGAPAAEAAPTQDSPAPDELQQASDALQGFRDIPNAIGQLANHMAGPDAYAERAAEVNANRQKLANLPVVGRFFDNALGPVPATLQGADKELQNEETAYQNRRAQAGETGMDGTRIAGNIVATAPVAAIMPQAAAGASLSTRTGAAALQGGALGLSQPVVDGGDNFASDKAKQFGVGAATAGLLTPIASGFARMLSPRVSGDVRKLLDEGIIPTPGQIVGGAAAKAEEKLTSVPLLGDAIKAGQRRAINQFNQAAYRRALAPIGKDAPDVGRKGMGEVRKQLGQAYDDLLPKIQFKPDAEFVSDIAKIEQMAQQMPPQQAAQFEKIIASKLHSRMTPQGNMAGETLKGVESELTRLAKGYKTDASFDNRELGDAVGEVLASLRRATERANPQYSKDLKALNMGWANYARLRRASSAIGADGGIFTPAQLQNAVKAEASKGSKSAFSEGSALMQDLSEAGKNVLGSKIPNSGTADRLMSAGAAGGIGAGAMMSPATLQLAAVAGVPALGYTPLGQRLLAAALTSRPAFAEPASELLRKAAPAIAAGGAAASNQLVGNR